VTDVPNPPGPDLPKVPTQPFSKLLAVVALLGLTGAGGYSYVALGQVQFGAPARDEVPASVRASPGGYRSFHFWHSGYHGGK
jgi:hypothetical protein